MLVQLRCVIVCAGTKCELSGGRLDALLLPGRVFRARSRDLSPWAAMVIKSIKGKAGRTQHQESSLCVCVPVLLFRVKVCIRRLESCPIHVPVLKSSSQQPHLRLTRSRGTCTGCVLYEYTRGRNARNTRSLVDVTGSIHLSRPLLVKLKWEPSSLRAKTLGNESPSVIFDPAP